MGSFTPATVTDIYRIGQGLESIAQRGWAADVGELFHGTAPIAAPVEDRRRVTVGAIGIAGPIERLCDGPQPRAEFVELRDARPRGPSRASFTRSPDWHRIFPQLTGCSLIGAP